MSELSNPNPDDQDYFAYCQRQMVEHADEEVDSILLASKIRGESMLNLENAKKLGGNALRFFGTSVTQFFESFGDGNFVIGPYGMIIPTKPPTSDSDL